MNWRRESGRPVSRCSMDRSRECESCLVTQEQKSNHSHVSNGDQGMLLQHVHASSRDVDAAHWKECGSHKLVWLCLCVGEKG